MKKEYFFLGFIIVLFLFTRLFKINQIPGSLYWDEASIGYNAYSVLHDGKDEWGSFLPVHFRAFGEFKLPIYIYSVAAVEKVFGPGIFSVRFPSVVYSLLSLVLVYVIAKKIFGGSSGLFSALIFTISPWYFIFSRTGYEVSAGLFFFLLGILFFLLINKRSYFFLFMVFSFILSFYSYNSFRILIPLFLGIFSIIFLAKKDIKVGKKLLYLIPGAFIFILALIPVYRLYILDAGAVRLIDVQASGKIEIIRNYLSHFSFSFLFGSGDTNSRSNIPGFGEIYLVGLPFLLFGTWVTVKERHKFWWLPFLAILVGAIPAAITKESPHALRSILMFPFLSIVIGVGIAYFVNVFKKNKILVVFGVTVLFLVSFENYFSNFLTTYFSKYSADWQYGYQKIFDSYAPTFEKYNKVIISDRYAQPYIFALYYQKYDPKEFRKSVAYNTVDQWGFSAVKSFGKFEFKKIDNSDLHENTLVFATGEDRINGVKPTGEINFLNGTTAFWVYTR